MQVAPDYSATRGIKISMSQVSEQKCSEASQPEVKYQQFEKLSKRSVTFDCFRPSNRMELIYIVPCKKDCTNLFE